MSHDPKEAKELSAADRLVDRATTQIRNNEPEPSVVEAAAERVWAKIEAAEVGAPQLRLVHSEEVHREDAAERDDAAGSYDSGDDGFTSETTPFAPAGRQGTGRLLPWALAATVVIGVGIAVFVALQMVSAGPTATVQTVDGQLFRVAAAAQQPIAVGDQIHEDDVLRTSREGGAIVRLNDGSLVELDVRSEISIDDGRKGTTINLKRGNVIVEAAEQRDRHLYVETDDCLVSVVGTIFSVNHGTKGSRVSVIEGEVKVDHDGEQSVLNPGDQVVTRQALGQVAVADEIAWSRDVEHYLELLREYADLRRELRQQVPMAGLRYDSRLLDLMPEDTVFYAAVPNLGETVAETRRVLDERLADSNVLADAWAEEAGHFQHHIDRAIEVFSEFSSFLGDEIAAGGYQVDNELGGVVVASEVVDSAGLRDFIDGHLSQADAEIQHEIREHLVMVDDPLSFVTSDESDALYVWLGDEVAIVTPSADQLRRVGAQLLEGAGNPFIGSQLHERISGLYRDGAEFALAVDIAGVSESALTRDDEEHTAQLDALGVRNARHLLLEQKQADQLTHHRASVSFDGARRGVAAWLAAPAPMGALEFVSPDAKLVASFVFEDPAASLDQIFAMAGDKGLPQALVDFEQRYGVSLRDDLAASLGGELTLAIDGPLLPVPAWKVVIETYDPARVQFVFEQALAEANAQLAAAGGTPLELTTVEAGSRTYYSLPAELFEVHYTFVDGYMLLAPNRVLLDQAIQFRQSGYTLPRSARFTSMLPVDGRNNFSALLYQDLSGFMSVVTERLAAGELDEEQKAALNELTKDERPTLGYVYAEEGQIMFAATSGPDFLSSLMLRMFGLQNPAGFEAIFSDLLKVSES